MKSRHFVEDQILDWYYKELNGAGNQLHAFLFISNDFFGLGLNVVHEIQTNQNLA